MTTANRTGGLTAPNRFAPTLSAERLDPDPVSGTKPLAPIH